MATKSKHSPVSLEQNVGVVMPNSNEEVQTQSAADTAEEVAQKHEKAVLAATAHAEEYVKIHSDFFAWIELDKAVREDAYIRAQKAALKAADQDADSELSKLEAKIAELKAIKERNAIAIGWAKSATPAPKTRGPKKASSWAAGAFNESDLMAIITKAPGLSSKEIAVQLSKTTGEKVETKALKTLTDKLREEKKVETKGQKAGLKFFPA